MMRRLRRRWCAAVIVPATDDWPETRSPMRFAATRRAARRQVPAVEALPSVNRAALDLGAWVDVRRYNRFGGVS